MPSKNSATNSDSIPWWVSFAGPVIFGSLCLMSRWFFSLSFSIGLGIAALLGLRGAYADSSAVMYITGALDVVLSFLLMRPIARLLRMQWDASSMDMYPEPSSPGKKQ